MNKVLVLIILVMLLSRIDGFSQSVRIDHVISVVNNIDDSVLKYRNLGFSEKPGYLHSNGLINAHIKFKNNSSYELMSLNGEANDKLSQTYQQLLQEKEGGVFIALTGMKTQELQHLLDSIGYRYEVATGKAWDYIVITDNRFLSPFFFIDYKIVINENVIYYEHKNQSTGFEKIYLEGNWQTKKFLEDIGFKLKGEGEYVSSTGSIIVVSSEHNARPRIVKIEFNARENITIR